MFGPGAGATPGGDVLPKKKKLTEVEIHDGWLENLRNEERTMKE